MQRSFEIKFLNNNSHPKMDQNLFKVPFMNEAYQGTEVKNAKDLV